MKQKRANDEIECSERCGLGCTKYEYDMVRHEGMAIKKKLGKGWKMIIWDNLGWHHRVVSLDGFINVSKDRGADKELYRAFISDTPHMPYVCWTGKGKTPQSAVQMAKQELRKHVNRQFKIISRLKQIAHS